jgi:hypothetical protein
MRSLAMILSAAAILVLGGCAGMYAGGDVGGKLPTDSHRDHHDQ